MAALSERHPDTLVDLHTLVGVQLEELLDEETGRWSVELSWDFRPSADLVRRFVDMRALTGFALLDGERVVGYSYFVVEDGKGLIGDLYVLEAYRTVERENLLLATVLDAIFKTPRATRVEAQLMMTNPLGRPVPYGHWFRSFPRLFLEAPLDRAVELEAQSVPGTVVLPWSERRIGEVAQLIATSYRGHVDSQINDQYRTPSGARRFLNNIVQYPGCGAFYSPASYVVEHQSTGRLCGVCLASLVAQEVGHITQVCVTPEFRGAGLGYELMRRSMLSLAARARSSVSLTVTKSNESAIRLYERMGFSTRCNFAACVWEKK